MRPIAICSLCASISQAWGLVRREAVYEVEDHVSAVCDVMRWLIEHDRPLEVQQGFFDEFVFTGRRDISAMR